MLMSPSMGTEASSIDDTASCSIARTLDIIGDRWTLLILRDVFRGVRRFTPIQEDLGVARNLLSDRLTRLVDAGVLEKVPYQDRPVRHEYRLTPKGVDLSPALVALMKWGDEWYSADGPPTVLVHAECGTPLEQVLSCPACNQHVSPYQITSRPGPTDHPPNHSTHGSDRVTS
ncbi:MAG: helix-turn-helix transcriptional regulator [Actinomycetia bacterium]|nr:helix-turn-helix transcriptional regulator [Actinomycetes bacterium]